MMARVLGLAAATFSAGSAAQALSDPTRPPLELMATAAATAPQTPLQSILLSPTRKGAIINGQYIPLGGSYGRSKLVAVSATEVTLRTGRSSEVLQLYPSLDKRSAASGTEQKPDNMVSRP